MSTNYNHFQQSETKTLGGLNRKRPTLFEDLLALLERMSVLCDALELFTEGVSVIPEDELK
jgi:hypothetical protein